VSEYLLRVRVPYIGNGPGSGVVDGLGLCLPSKSLGRWASRSQDFALGCRKTRLPRQPIGLDGDCGVAARRRISTKCATGSSILDETYHFNETMLQPVVRPGNTNLLYDIPKITIIWAYQYWKRNKYKDALRLLQWWRRVPVHLPFHHAYLVLMFLMRMYSVVALKTRLVRAFATHHWRQKH
jgi:hypothetical protein